MFIFFVAEPKERKMELRELELPGLELVDPNADYSGTQTIFIDFDGAENVSYDNDALGIYINDITVAHSGLSEEEQFKIITDLNTTFAGTGVFFTVSAPTNEEYSTIYVGETTSPLSGEWELLTTNFQGLAETIDAGNLIKNDEAFIFSDNIDSTITITETIAHEAGHIIGYKHTGNAQTITSDNLTIGDYALNSISSGFGVTFVTHGFNSDSIYEDFETKTMNTESWLYNMGLEIGSKMLGKAGLDTNDIAFYSFDLIQTDNGPLFSTYNINGVEWLNSSNRSGQAVVLLNWSDYDEHITSVDTISTEVIGNLFYSAILSYSTPDFAIAPMHFIGHSRGGSLIGAISENLGEKGIWVDQLTFLDPHPTENGIGEDDWGEEGMVVPENVIFADNYYREGGILWPNGKSVDGAINIQLNESHFDDGWREDEPGYESEHSDVHLWYHGTIDTDGGFDDGKITVDALEAPLEAPLWYTREAFQSPAWLDNIDVNIGRETMGYAYSLVEGIARPISGISRDFQFPENGITTGGVRGDSLLSENSDWANIGYIKNISGTSNFSVDDSIDLNYYYANYSSSPAVILFYLDDNCNPNDGNLGLIVTRTNVTTDVAVDGYVGNNDISWKVTSEYAGNSNLYIYGGIYPISGHTRYSYMPGTISINEHNAPPPPPNPDPVEPNNSPGEAVDYETIYGELDIKDVNITTGDVDFYKFTLAETGTADSKITLYIKNDAHSGEGQYDLDFAIGKFNNKDNFYPVSGRWHDWMCETDDRDESISLEGVAPGTYYVFVYGYSAWNQGLTDDFDEEFDFSKGTEVSDYQLTINAPIPLPHLAISSDSHDFGSSETNWSFDIGNVGAGILNYEVSDTGESWLDVTVYDDSATSPDEDSAIVTINRSLLSVGTNEATITVVNSNDANEKETITISATGDNGVENCIYNPENGHYYQLVMDNISWTDAKTAAEIAGGYLSTITSSEENQFVFNLIADATNTGTWLGGYQSVDGTEPHGGWQWVTGENWDYTNWSSGEPNDSNDNEDYLQYHPSSSPVATWNDASNTLSSGGYVIEWENEYITLDGIDDYVDCGSGGLPDNPLILTQSAWVRTTADGQTTVLTKRHADDGADWPSIVIENGIAGIYVDDKSNISETSGTSLINDGVWHHIVGVRDGTQYSIYVDGLLELTKAYDGSNLGGSPYNYHIGHHGAWNQYFNGDVDEVAVWQDALTAEEIAVIYNAGRNGDLTANIGNYVSSSELDGYWRFNNISGNTAIDSSANDNDGTIVGQVNAAVPDLAVLDVDCKNEPWEWGSQVQIDVNLTNDGTANASNITIKLVASNDDTPGDNDDYTIKTWSEQSINAGEQWGVATYTFNLPGSPYPNMPENGTVYYFVTASTASGEVELANNSLADSVTMSTPAVPEISVHGGGSNNDTYEIYDDDFLPRTADNTDFGSVAASSGSITKTFTIKNTGNATLNISGFSLSDNSNFTLLNNLTSVGADSSATISIEFDPTSDEVNDCTVIINNSDSNEGTYTFKIMGTGQADPKYPEISIHGGGNNNDLYEIFDDNILTRTADNTDFGSISTSSGSITKTFTIKNTGDATLSISSSSLSDNSNFTLLNNLTSVGAGSSATISIKFDPTSDGTKESTVTINNNDSNEGTYTFKITGYGLADPKYPEISVHGGGSNNDTYEISDDDIDTRTADNTDFGSVSASSGSITKTFTIKNTGNATLNISGFSLSDNSNFIFTAGNSLTSLPVGSTGTFTIKFDPTSDGVKACTVTINNNDADEGTYTFKIMGTGLADPKYPDLTPHQPSGWSDKIVASTVTGTNTDSTTITEDDTIYIDWAIINSGDADCEAYNVSLYIDDNFEKSWSFFALNSGWYQPEYDYDAGSLSAGTYTLRLVVDGDNDIAESDKTNNSYTKIITVNATPKPTVTVSVIDSDAGEPDNNGTYRISLSEAITSDLTVYFSMGGDATEGSDYNIGSSVTITAGEVYTDVILYVINDTEIEPTETAILTLSSDSGYELGTTTSGTVNITDDDIPTVTVSVIDGNAGEPDNNGSYRISLSEAITSDLTVYFTMSGAATEGSDYETIGSSVTITAGVTYANIKLDVIDDTTVESPERATLTLTSNSSYDLSSVKSEYIDIHDNDDTGDSYTTATLIDISSPYSKLDYVRLNDSDYYKFIPTGNGEFDFSLTGLSGKIKGSVVRDDAARGKKRIASLKTDKKTGLTAVDNVLLKDGETYYAVIKSASTGKFKYAYSTDYTLDITPDYFPEATHDNSWKTAQALDGDPVGGWVGFGDDCDWYEFDMTTAGTVDLKLSGLQSDANMNLYYYDNRKNKLKCIGKSKNKGAADELISEMVDTGTYYAEVIPGKKINNATYNLDLDITYGV
jgi:stress response protein SCP2